MKTTTKNNTDFKITIKNKGSKSITYDLWELETVCWDYIYELERGNQEMYLSEHELLDSLMQNYFTCKLVYTECGNDLSKEMESIEEFIIKHQRRISTAMHLKELNESSPKMSFIED